MSLKNNAKNLIEELKQKWLLLQDAPDVFAYKLNITKRKVLPGSCGIYSELNTQRPLLRRFPQTIPNLKTAFDEEKFNFKKINPHEIMTEVHYEAVNISMIVNNSPLTLFHTLICPDVNAGHAQCLTPLALSFSVMFLLNLNKENDGFRIGFNSAGAYASVNHLHLHLMFIPIQLYIDNAQLTLLSDKYIYRLNENMPTEAICYVFQESDEVAEINQKIKKLHDFIVWLCDNNIPHNVFITPDRNDNRPMNMVKVFVYARAEFSVVKNLCDYNVAFCEFSGFVPVGTEIIYNNLCEEDVLDRIRDETKDVYKQLYKYFTLN